MADRAILEDILNKAIWAPSADNTQPWRAELTATGIELYLLPERDISPYDSVPRGSMVAHGAFIENAVLTAGAKEYSMDVSIHMPSKENEWQVATLTMGTPKTQSEVDAKLYKHINDRATNRKQYLTTLLSPMEKDFILNAGRTGWGNIQILDNPQHELCQAVSTTERISFQNEHVHRELFKNIRWTDAEVAATHDGFSISTFELPLPARVIFMLAKRWDWLVYLNSYLGVAKEIPKQTSVLYGKSAAYVGISGEINELTDFIQVGRILQRVWLATTFLGMYMQPIGALLFFKKGIDEGTTTAFSAEDTILINSAYENIQKIFDVRGDEKVIMVLRAGPASPPTAKTIRRTLKSVISG